MKHYIDITLLPDAETNLGFIWQKVYQQVHLGLVESKTETNDSDVAISFPENGSSDFPLGTKLRLLSLNQESLQQLNINKWLSRLLDYVHCTSIKEVPAGVTQYVRFSRKQFKTNIEKLARRRAKRKGESFDKAMEHYKGFKDEQSKLPFINMRSLSSDRQFRLFVEKELLEKSVEGKFNCYGLSKTATVPWF